MMIQLDVDVVTQLKSLLPSYYELVVPSLVIDELDRLKNNAKGKDKLAATVALSIAKSEAFSQVSIAKTEHVDNLLLKYCSSDDVLCTNDRNLRKKARELGITVVYLRQRRYLEVDGYIKHNE
ncbi:MAG: PIN domain-containing protein [Methanosphaera sp.]|nr:PIN domain-containing protein [Methanosphaera sp.]